MFNELDYDHFLINKDTYYQQQLRTISSLPDPDRPKEERFLELFYASLCDDRAPASRVIPHSDLLYVRAALESQFPDRKFTIKEICALIKEVYDVDY